MITQRQNAGGLVGGVILIGLGVFFLVGQYFSFRGFEFIWPLFVIGMGGVFFLGMLAGGKSLAALAIPGSILTTLGLLLLFQNLTGHWESWSYVWTILIMAVGIGLFIMGAWTGNREQRGAGLRVASLGLVLFAGFGSLFELLLFGGIDEPWRRAVAPALLILAGLILIVRRSGLLPRGGGRTPAERLGHAPETPPAPPAQP